MVSCGLYVSIFTSFIALYCVFSYSTGNFKAVYQRARAHAALCNEDEARRDLDTVQKLDPKFKPFVCQELKKLCERVRTMHVHQNKTYWDMTQEKWGPGGSKGKSAARKKNVKSSENKSVADKKSEESQNEQQRISEKMSPAETEEEEEAETKGNPDVKAEHGNNVLESGRDSEEGLDNENI